MRFADAVAAMLALLLTLASRSAHAQDAGAASQGSTAASAGVQPPRLTSDPGVVYPAQALGERFFERVTVVLVVEIDATGAVTNATVEAPQGHGFDETATSAARKLVFEPARRGDHPVAARIRFTYSFVPPSPRLAGRVARQASDAPIAGATVTVRDVTGGERTVTTAADGTWSVGELPAGRVHVAVAAPAEAPFASDEEVTPGEETQLVVRLAPGAPPASTSDAAAGGPVEEVTVRGERPPREVTKRTLTKDEIAHIPGTNGDALRSLQNLPGVARPPPFSGGLIVRGSAPQDTNVFVDGTNIPLVYHFGAFSSVVPTELLERIDFVPGNYSALYGRGMGGIVDVGLRDPRKDGFHGIAQADLIDTRLLVEGPILRTGWSFLVAARRSWFDVWLDPILKGSGAGITAAPVYYDYQAMLQKDLSSRQSVRFLLLGSDDALHILNQSPSASDPTFGGAINAHTSFWRVQGRYENRLTDETSLRLLAAYGQDVFDGGTPARFQRTTSNPLSGRVEVAQKLGAEVTANFGLDMVYEPYDLRVRRAPPRRPGQPDLGVTDTPIETSHSGTLFLPGLYTEWEVTPFRGTRIVPGFRADFDDATQSWDFAPRISARQDLTSDFPRTTLKGGVGVYYQPPTPFETDPQYGQTGLGSNRSVHYDVGVEQELTRQVDLSVDGFYKSFDHLVVPSSGNSGTGEAYGVEWLLRYKPDEHFFGWLSYTLSRSVRRDVPGEPLRLFQYDQTHILTAVASYKLGRGWQVGGRFRLISGPLDTTSSYGAFDAAAGAQLSVDSYPPYGQRLPLFHQLDLRADKTWTFSAWKLSAYLDIQNVYSAQAAEGLSYNYNFTQSTYVRGLPILPSLGIRAEF